MHICLYTVYVCFDWKIVIGASSECKCKKISVCVVVYICMICMGDLHKHIHTYVHKCIHYESQTVNETNVVRKPSSSCI
jgi:hypothetical protein